MNRKLLKTSARMAIAMGIFLPLAETIRRANQLLNPALFFKWFDDYLLGAVLLIAAYWVKQNKTNAAAYLIAAWGIGVGALFLSFIAQFDYYQAPTGDPGLFSTTLVAIAKALILTYMLLGLHLSIKSQAPSQHP